MASDSSFSIQNNKSRCAVVTGANKGIGLEVCRQLASNGVTVVLTARDEKKGIEALEKLISSSHDLSAEDHLLFHVLDVKDATSIASLADFVKTQFGRLDILVNNAGVSGVIVDGDSLKAALDAKETRGEVIDWYKIMNQTYEAAVECLETNYYGPKRMIETFIPLLNLSSSPRIVNVSSSMGKLNKIPNEWAKSVLNDGKSLTEERVAKVLNEFLKDFKEGSLETKRWPCFFSAYIVSKAALNAYTRILAKKKHGSGFLINCVCPGFVKTDINFNTGIASVEEGAENVVRLALLPDDGPSGLFFVQSEESSFE